MTRPENTVIKTTGTLAQNLLHTFEGDNWTDVSIADTLADISFKEAITRTAASPNTIASLVNHLWYWNTIIMLRMKGENPVIPEENGFDVGKLNTEHDWKKLVAKTHRSFIDLADAIRNFPPEKLPDPVSNGRSTVSRNLYGIIEHAYYHLGQIVMLKHLVKNS
jgi:uncharacterized damage-inducible protein DinB